MDLEELRSLHKKVFKLFRYKKDKANYGIMEDWRNHADKVMQNEYFVDDCDGFAFTCIKLMLDSGADPANVMFVVCETETGDGHAVSGYTLGDKTYILENRSNTVYDWQDQSREYSWSYFMTFDEPGQWYKIRKSTD